ncbi:MAG: glycoside hydrolase family 99-like domain-containing protein [Parvularculaceae bacterium]
MAALGADPLTHYLKRGWVQGRDPNPLFQNDYYLENNPDVAAGGANPLLHFAESGAREGRKPSPLFDIRWYVAQNPDVAEAGVNPLVHYLTAGASEGRAPNVLFDPEYYRREAGLTKDVNALAHYAETGGRQGLPPHPLFDGKFYLKQNPDVAKANKNPLVHYLERGGAELRQPHPLFDAAWYVAQNPDVAEAGVNPLVHYLTAGASEGRAPSPRFDTAWYLTTYPEVVTAGVNPLAHYAERENRDPSNAILIVPADPALEGSVPLTAVEPPANVPVRTIAFYLPQFHRIPENDAWWGEGFTEWAKVKPAKPCFEGHYQPHEPGELGYYDLINDEKVLARQAELAKLHGIGGFAFYFYWFAGKRLLEAPVQKYLQSAEIDFPFCLCWANENWSRRWDGGDKSILIAQEHSPESDLAFIAYIAQYLRDPRYIRIGGRPLLIIYRPALLPNAKQTAERWRQWARENGLGELYLAFTQSFEVSAPSVYGFDAAIEFPPNNSGQVCDPSLVKLMSTDSQLSIYDWRRLAGKSLNYENPAYKLFRGINCGWDNTARRPRDGAVFINASPSGYKAWLQNAVADTLRRFDDPEERLVFINAWNEWAEGAHLEPDRKHGYAWLEATRQGLGCAAERKKKFLVVTHDLHKHGAQYLALNILRTLRRRYGLEVASIAGGPGDLAAAFEAEGPLTILDIEAAAADVDAIVSRFADQGFARAIVNSAASGWIAPALARRGIEMIGLVHEMSSVIGQMGLEPYLRALDLHARATVFPASVVRDRAAQAAGLVGWRNAFIAPQGVYKSDAVFNLDEKENARATVLRRLGLPQNAQIVLGVGYADERKGVDIFIEWAQAAVARWPNLHFVWLGASDPAIQAKCEALIAHAGSLRNNIHFPGFVEATGEFYKAASLYALTSREDPFPSTALEALNAATPVFMIRGTGGIEDLGTHSFVRLVPTASASEFVEAAAEWLEDAAARLEAGWRGRDMMREKFGFASYVGTLADLLGAGLPNISVVVPNYNYARHLRQRLASILNQTLLPREIIFLDDASTDDSVAVAEWALHHSPVNWRIVRNQRNSGSVFAQWRKGVELSIGDLVWIAEADDWSDPQFLETAAAAFARKDVVLSYTQSHQATSEGRVTANDYLDYVRDISPERWMREFIALGPDEVRAGLSVKNTIPNVSAAVFRRTALAEVLTTYRSEIESYRVAGDWCVYVNLARKGAIAFNPKPLNFHRRHQDSVTIARFDLAELSEIARMQAYVDREFAPPQEYRHKARAYLDSLVKHFRLDRHRTPAEIDAAMRAVSAAR